MTRGRIAQWLTIVIALSVLVAIALTRVAQLSTYSSYDTGANGYLAFFNVLSDEGVRMQRAGRPMGLEIKDAGVWLFTSSELDRTTTGGLFYDSNEIKTLAAFVKQGGRVVAFTGSKSDAERIKKAFKFAFTSLNANEYTNGALDKNPHALLRIYQLLAGHGVVKVDERLHGYGTDRTLWSALPAAVHVAFWLLVVALVIALVDGNVRVAPPILREPPPDRDSSAYIISMASLLRRARAPHSPGTAAFLQQRKERS